MRTATGRGRLRAESLPASRVRKRDRDLSNEGRDGHEAVEKTACDTLHGQAVISVLHVWTRRPNEKGQVREVPAALRSAARGVLGSPEERQTEGGRGRVPHDDEPDQESHGRRGRMFRKLQDASHSPGKKDSSSTEVLVEEDWIWWNAEKNQVATKSGKVTTILRNGEAILEDGLRVWEPGDDGPILARVGGANLPIDGGGTGPNNN